MKLATKDFSRKGFSVHIIFTGDEENKCRHLKSVYT